jgi:hypothetical protein
MNCSKCNRDLVIPAEILINILEKAAKEEAMIKEIMKNNEFINGDVNVNDVINHYHDDPVYSEKDVEVNENSEEYFPIGFTVTFEQKVIVEKALDKVKKDIGASTTTEALIALCAQELEEE